MMNDEGVTRLTTLSIQMADWEVNPSREERALVDYLVINMEVR